MDELSLLEAVSSEDVAAAEAAVAPDTALIAIQRPDFTGSLDYIDSLASRSAIAVSQRDVANIATAAYLSRTLDVEDQKAVLGRGFTLESITDFRPLGDARRFHPEFQLRPMPELVRSASRVQSGRSVIRSDFPPQWRNPLDPGRDVGDLNRALRDAERRIRRHPFAFRKPNQLVVCLKRKIRRAVMASMNFPRVPFRPRRTNVFSRVVC